jgi:hypothetical protein
MGQEWFCYSIHIITGVTLFYATGGGFMAEVIFSCAHRHPGCEHIILAPPSVIFSLLRQPHIQLFSGAPVVFGFTCSGEGRQSRFWGVSRLSVGSLVIGTAFLLHYIAWDDYTDRYYID